MKKLTQKEFENRVTSGVDIIGNFIDTRTKVEFKCLCGNKSLANPSHLMSGTLCSFGCGLIKKGKSKPIDERYKIITDGFRYIEVQCKSCNSIYKTDKANFKKCSCKLKDNKLKLEKFIKDNENFIINSRKDITCKKCGFNFSSKKEVLKCTNCTVLDKKKNIFKILENKNIKFFESEPKFTIKTRQLFVCSCGDIFDSTLNNIKNGTKCKKCKKAKTIYDNTEKSISDIYLGKRTILYYVKCKGIYKIGICLNKTSNPIYDIDNRFRRYKVDMPQIISFKIFENGIDAFLEEQRIISAFKDYRYFGDEWFKSTELFNCDILKKDNGKYIEYKYIKGKKPEENCQIIVS